MMSIKTLVGWKELAESLFSLQVGTPTTQCSGAVRVDMVILQLRSKVGNVQVPSLPVWSEVAFGRGIIGFPRDFSTGGGESGFRNRSRGF